jgi:transposase
VISAVEGGASYRQAAGRYGVSASAALKWARHFRQTGSVGAKPMGGDRRSRLKAEREWLLQRIAAAPELTAAELHKELRARGIQVSYLTLRRFLRKERIDVRKNAHAGRGRPLTSAPTEI